MGPKRKDPPAKADGDDSKKGKKSKAADTAAQGGETRKSGRERKAVNYNEDAIIKETETKPRAGGYSYPNDPPGMKSTAYMCKTPMAHPPHAEVLPGKAKPPKRNARGEWEFADHPNFRPNLSPAEVMKDGAFGGTYFRKITSFVNKETYENAHEEFPEEWFKGLRPHAIHGKAYNAAHNKWGVECGGALDMWESSGWITAIDPYGWFQWYCRFFLGRRSTDDERQISRHNGVAGPKGRFKTQLANKVVASGRKFDDPNVSPVIRQTLHHWACALTEKDVEAARRR